MHLFFHRHAIHVLELDSLQYTSAFDHIIEGTGNWQSLQGHVLWLLPSLDAIESVLQAVFEDQFSQPVHLVLAVKRKKLVLTIIHAYFKIVKAAGGIVEKDSRILLIHRHGRWDLPKGKQANNKERTKITAKREVEEECGVQVQCLHKIGTTYHALFDKNQGPSLKRTTWYHMRLLNDHRMRPQREEGIEQVAWVDIQEAYTRLEESYAAIRHIIRLRQLHLLQSS